MVGETRHNQEGFGEGNGSRNQQNLPPPPPPPPSLAQMLATQNELLRQILQQQQQPGGRHHQQPQEASYQDFLTTQPPLFHPSDDPFDADAWIRTLESKFLLLTVPCSDYKKARYAVQQLRGAARLWWDSHAATLQPGHQMN
jgi:hypothetical protein